MMKLSQAARYFHNTPFYDAYSTVLAFKGHLTAYADSSRDSLSTERRIMGVVPGQVIPARRVVKVGQERYIVGESFEDHHGDEVLRQKYVLHRAEALATVRTFSQALAGAGGQTIWASRLWVKETKEVSESANMYGSYQIYMSSSEDLRHPDWANGTFSDGREVNVMIQMEGRWHLVRATAMTAAGLMVAVADELPEPVILSVQYTVNTYVIATDSKTSVTTTVSAVNLRWQSYFTYLAAYSTKFEEGDVQLVVLKTAVPATTAGDTVTVQGRKYRVITVFDHGDVWTVHLRYA